MLQGRLVACSPCVSVMGEKVEFFWGYGAQERMFMKLERLSCIFLGDKVIDAS